VQDVVVQVERLDDRRMRQEQALHPGLTGQVQHPFGVPDPLASGNPAGRAHRGELPGELPQPVQAEQQSGFPGHTRRDG
jgi:hypothetical protein